MRSNTSPEPPVLRVCREVAGWRLSLFSAAQLIKHQNMSRGVSFSLVFFTLLAALLIAGCGGVGFAYEKRLSGKYGLVATDVLEQMSLCEMLPGGSATGVISKTVFAVGWDEGFVIAQQHPSGNKSITNSYILRVSDGELTGPLDEAAFGVERTTLGVPPSLSFTLIFDSLK